MERPSYSSQGSLGERPLASPERREDSLYSSNSSAHSFGYANATQGHGHFQMRALSNESTGQGASNGASSNAMYSSNPYQPAFNSTPQAEPGRQPTLGYNGYQGMSGGFVAPTNGNSSPEPTYKGSIAVAGTSPSQNVQLGQPSTTTGSTALPNRVPN